MSGSYENPMFTKRKARCVDCYADQRVDLSQSGAKLANTICVKCGGELKSLRWSGWETGEYSAHARDVADAQLLANAAKRGEALRRRGVLSKDEAALLLKIGIELGDRLMAKRGS